MPLSVDPVKVFLFILVITAIFTANTTNSKSKEDIFGDLLGSQGYSFSSSKFSSGPKTINEMRKEEMAREMDPDKLKVDIIVRQVCNS